MSVFNTYAFTVRGAQISVEKAQNAYRIDVISGDVTVVLWLREKDTRTLSNMIAATLAQPVGPQEKEHGDVFQAWMTAVTNMSPNEFLRVCRDLGFDPKSLAGNTHSSKAVTLFDYLETRLQTNLLKRYYNKYLKSAGTGDEPVSIEHDKRDVHHAWTAAVNNMTVDKLAEICFQLGVDYENLPANTRMGKGIELFNFLQRSMRLHLLEPYYKNYL